MKNDLQSLKKIYEELNRKVRVIREGISELEDKPKAKALVNKYFKRKISYTSQMPDPWIYTKIISSINTNVFVNGFYEESSGEIVFIHHKLEYFGSFDNNASQVPITRKEYYKAYKKLVDKLIRRYKADKKK